MTKRKRLIPGNYVVPTDSESAWNESEEQRALDAQEAYEQDAERRRKAGDFDWKWDDTVQLVADVGSFVDELFPPVVLPLVKSSVKTAKILDTTNDLTSEDWKQMSEPIIETAIDALPPRFDIPVSLWYYGNKYADILYEKTLKKPARHGFLKRQYPFKQYSDNTYVSKPYLNFEKIERK